MEKNCKTTSPPLKIRLQDSALAWCIVMMKYSECEGMVVQWWVKMVLITPLCCCWVVCVSQTCMCGGLEPHTEFCLWSAAGAGWLKVIDSAPTELSYVILQISLQISGVSGVVLLEQALESTQFILVLETDPLLPNLPWATQRLWSCAEARPLLESSGELLFSRSTLSRDRPLINYITKSWDLFYVSLVCFFAPILAIGNLEVWKSRFLSTFWERKCFEPK